MNANDYDVASRALHRLDLRLQAAESLLGPRRSERLIFQDPPDGVSDRPPSPALSASDHTNTNAMAYELELLLLDKAISDINVPDSRLKPACQQLRCSIDDLTTRWRRAKLQQWVDQSLLRRSLMGSKAEVIDTCGSFCVRRTVLLTTGHGDRSARHFNKSHGLRPVPFVSALVAAILYLIFNASQKLTEFVLFALELVVDLAHTDPRPEEDPRQRRIPPIPQSLERALAALNLEPDLEYFAQCPGCFKVFCFEDGDCPAFCDDVQPGEVACGTKVMRPVRVQGTWQMRPIRPFIYQSPKHWIGRMLSRKRFEYMMNTTARQASVKEVAADIWDAPCIHQVKWPDGLSYAQAPQDELRLVLTMGVDWFKVHKGGNKTWSVGAVYLIILNLPPTIRYRPENVCLVAIIPGPKKAPTEFLHRLLRPVVDEMLPFWTDGIRYERTSDYQFGRLVRALILLLVCDLEAARALGGFMQATHTHVCSVCHTLLSGLTNFDVSTWNLRDGAKHKDAGELWKKAVATERKRLETTLGARYSEIHRLPYHDPVRHTVIDSMHNILLGLLQRHFRKLFRMSVLVEGGDGTGFSSEPKRATLEELREGRRVYLEGKGKTGRSKALKSLKQHVLVALCTEYDAFTGSAGKPMTKNALIADLEAKVRSAHGCFDSRCEDG